MQHGKLKVIILTEVRVTYMTGAKVSHVGNMNDAKVTNSIELMSSSKLLRAMVTYGT